MSRDEEKSSSSMTATNNNGPRASIMSDTVPYTEDVVRAHRRLSPMTVESQLHQKLCALEGVMNKLCNVWQGIEVSN